MATKFREVRGRMPPEQQERIRKRTQELLTELPLQELRQARALSQEELADVLGLKGPHPGIRRPGGNGRSCQGVACGCAASHNNRAPLPLASLAPVKHGPLPSGSASSIGACERSRRAGQDRGGPRRHLLHCWPHSRGAL
jgi:hypothetical protein